MAPTPGLYHWQTPRFSFINQDLFVCMYLYTVVWYTAEQNVQANCFNLVIMKLKFHHLLVADLGFSLTASAVLFPLLDRWITIKAYKDFLSS